MYAVTTNLEILLHILGSFEKQVFNQAVLSEQTVTCIVTISTQNVLHMYIMLKLYFLWLCDHSYNNRCFFYKSHMQMLPLWQPNPGVKFFPIILYTNSNCTEFTLFSCTHIKRHHDYKQLTRDIPKLASFHACDINFD